jgi:Co/Zn/Cd efflux system component
MNKRLVAIALGALFLPMLGADTPHANVLPVLVVSAIAAVILLIGALILGSDPHDHDHLNMRTVPFATEDGENDSRR